MTPLYDALCARASHGGDRFHMPGHKGHPPLAKDPPFLALDFTELHDTGNLYLDINSGPIRHAERLFAEACQAAHCLFLTGGATQGVLTLLTAYAPPGAHVIVDRNSHISIHNALALLDLHPVWLRAPLIDPFGITGPVAPNALQEALGHCPDAACVLITTPTYYGVQSDVPSLAAHCRSANVPLLVDAAHGAHLPFFPDGVSPVTQGASAAVLSAHKTLPALGQAAVLLSDARADVEHLRACAALYGSSSPSYLLMASLDVARSHMTWQGRGALLRVADRVQAMRRDDDCLLSSFLPGAPSLDPLRLCLYTGRGHETARWLERTKGIVCEMSDARNVVFLCSPSDEDDALARLSDALSHRPPPRPQGLSLTTREPPQLPQAGCSPRQALFARHVQVPTADAVGRIAAQPIAPYPPGVPLVARGEIISGPVAAFLTDGSGDSRVTIVEEEFL